MPNRDYYLRGDSVFRRTQSAYRAHVTTLLRLADPSTSDGDASRRAALVVELERRFAESHWPLAETRDADKTYNVWTPAQLAERAPGFDWAAFLAEAGLGDRTTLVVGEPSAVTSMARAIGETPLPVLQDWLTVRLAKDRPLVSPAGRDRGGVRLFRRSAGRRDRIARPVAPGRGAHGRRPHRCSGATVHRATLPARHQGGDGRAGGGTCWRRWTSGSRRSSGWRPRLAVKARVKLAAFTPMIGYPNRWRRYDELDVRPDDAYGNFRRSAVYEWDRRLARIDKAVERDEWTMMPITANAYASFANNQIVFPAAYPAGTSFRPARRSRRELRRDRIRDRPRDQPSLRRSGEPL